MTISAPPPYAAFVVALALALTAPAAHAQDDPGSGVGPLPYGTEGTSGWQFLKLPTDARTAALSGVRSAIGYGDAAAALTNPAAAASVEGTGVSISRMEWVADITLNGASVVQDLGRWGTVGANIVYLDYGDMDRTANLPATGGGVDLGVVPTTDLGSFSAHDLAVGVLYTRRVTDKLQLGGNLRYLQQTLDDATTSNWSLDVGTLYRTGFRSLRISMLGQNFGPDSGFEEFDDRIQRPAVRVRMPAQFVLGVAYDLFEPSAERPLRWTLAGEYVRPNDGGDRFNVASEAVVFDALALRAGYRLGYDVLGLTLGGGVHVATAGSQIRADYAYTNAGPFEGVHMVSLGFEF